MPPSHAEMGTAEALWGPCVGFATVVARRRGHVDGAETTCPVHTKAQKIASCWGDSGLLLSYHKMVTALRLAGRIRVL